MYDLGARAVDFERSFDVLVAGGGVAGVAAALEAARNGLKTALVEKTIQFGGLATSGLIDVYLPLCDGNGTQVMFGITEELLHKSIKYGPGTIPPGWQQGRNVPEPKRYRVIFSPAAFVLALDEVLVEAGAELWLDTLVCAPVMEGNRLAGLEVENKSGRGLFRAKAVVDATGDADVACRAGAECADGDNWVTIWALMGRLERAQQAVAAQCGDPLYDGIRLGGDNAGHGDNAGWRTPGTDAEDVTRFVLASRQLLTDNLKARFAKHGADERHNYFPLTLPSMAQFRTTRRICGHATMSDGGYGQHVPDSVGLVADWRKPGYVWEIPYGALVPRRVTGLLTAGRCISSEGDAWQVTRVIPPAAHTGQVAGLAATLALRHDTTPDQLDAHDVQTELATRKIPLHMSDVGL